MLLTCVQLLEGNGNPLQYSCLENPMESGAWQATVHGVAKSPTQLQFHFLLYKPSRLFYPWNFPPLGDVPHSGIKPTSLQILHCRKIVYL